MNLHKKKNIRTIGLLQRIRIAAGQWLLRSEIADIDDLQSRLVAERTNRTKDRNAYRHVMHHIRNIAEGTKGGSISDAVQGFNYDRDMEAEISYLQDPTVKWAIRAVALIAPVDRNGVKPTIPDGGDFISPKCQGESRITRPKVPPPEIRIIDKFDIVSVNHTDQGIMLGGYVRTSMGPRREVVYGDRGERYDGPVPTMVEGYVQPLYPAQKGVPSPAGNCWAPAPSNERPWFPLAPVVEDDACLPTDYPSCGVDL